MALLIMGAAVFVWKLWIVLPIQFVGYCDAAAYPEMAESLLQGRGFEVDYISMFFKKFDTIAHPEDTWPPLHGVLIAPFFAILGKSAFAAKLPAMLIGALGIPWITFLLAWRLSRSRGVALAAGLTVLVYGPMFMWSLYALSDLTFGFFVLLALYCAVRGEENPKWFIAMGAAFALAYFAKQLALMPIAGVIAWYLAKRIFQRPLFPLQRKDLFFAAGLGCMLLILMPWFIRSQVHFGDPLYNNHKHVTGYLGWKPWEENTYAVYWDRELPQRFDRIEQDPKRVLDDSKAYLYNHFRTLFIRSHPHLCLREENAITVNAQSNIPEFSVKDPSTYWTGLPALAGIVVFLLLKLFRRDATAFKGFGLFLFAGGFQVMSISVLWLPVNRYNTPLIPMVAIMGWITAWLLLRRLPDMVARRAGMIVVLLCAVWTGIEMQDVIHAQNHQTFPWKDTGENVIAMADWVKENLPDARVMTRNAWSMHFYSGVPCVRLPSGPMRDVIRVAEHYKVTHITPDKQHPDFARWSRLGLPGLKSVHNTKGGVLFEIDYDLVPEEFRPLRDRFGSRNEK